MKQKTVTETLLFPRRHTKSFQLSISVPGPLAPDVAQALAFLMQAGDNGLPFNKSEATYRAIIEHAQARGWHPNENGGSA